MKKCCLCNAAAAFSHFFFSPPMWSSLSSSVKVSEGLRRLLLRLCLFEVGADLVLIRSILCVSERRRAAGEKLPADIREWGDYSRGSEEANNTQALSCCLQSHEPGAYGPYRQQFQRRCSSTPGAGGGGRGALLPRQTRNDETSGAPQISCARLSGLLGEEERGWSWGARGECLPGFTALPVDKVFALSPRGPGRCSSFQDIPGAGEVCRHFRLLVRLQWLQANGPQGYQNAESRQSNLQALHREQQHCRQTAQARD